MIFKTRFLATSTLLCLCTIAASAQAGQLFPPNNIGSNPDVSCPHGGVLTWHGDHVDCVNPTPGVTVSCPAGQVLTGINNGNAVCANAVATRTDLTMGDLINGCGYPADPNPPSYDRFQFDTTCVSRWCTSNIPGDTWGMLTENGPGYNGGIPWNSDPNTPVSVVCGP